MTNSLLGLLFEFFVFFPPSESGFFSASIHFTARCERIAQVVNKLEEKRKCLEKIESVVKLTLPFRCGPTE